MDAKNTIVLFIHPERRHLTIIALHPHLTILHKILHYIQNFLSIGDSQNLEFHTAELDGVEGTILTGDKDNAIVEWGADLEADILIREKDDIGCITKP